MQETIEIFPERKFYVYVHRRASDGVIFYVGKGCGDRLAKYDNRNRHWRNVVAKHGFSAEIVADNLSEPCALSHERALISAIGRGNLVNMTDGGEGVSGYRFSDEQRASISAAVSVSFTPERREAMRKFRMGKPPGNAGMSPSPETRRKISNANKGRQKPDGFGERVAERQRGVKRPAHVIEAMRSANIGKRIPDETRRKISQSLSGERSHWHGKKLTEDHRKNISASRIGIGKRAVIRSDGKVFSSAKDAAEHMRENGYPKAAPTSITCACKGKQSTAYGYEWAYV